MKKLILSISLIAACTFVNAQVQKDNQGNYYQTKIVKTIGQKSQDKPTGKYFTDNSGNKYPVMISVNGKLFVWKTSKKINPQSN